MQILLLSIILAPFAASLLTYLFRIKTGWMTILAATLTLAASSFLAFANNNTSATDISFSGFSNQPFHLYANASAFILSSIVSVTAFSIFIYSLEYMKEEKGKTWFWAGISLFLSGMQLLVFAGDWVLFVTAWEIMGFASFLLIGTWHRKAAAQQGAVKAFMLTRFTDMGLYAAVFVIVLTAGNIHMVREAGQPISTLGGIFLLVAVMGKSAQLPFQSWLSAAMAGPTPVSALLHSATMVAAGAILLFRTFPLLNANVLFLTGLVGGITILFTGLTAVASRDVKQLLAASTSSQLGFMLLAVGSGNPGAAFAHWVAHAFMKSSLFLGAGTFQHVYHSTAFEDLRGAGKKLKATFTGFAIAGIGLSGIPPLVGYWSKDGILAATTQSHYSTLFFSIAVGGAFFTAVYMGKAISQLWHGPENVSPEPELQEMPVGLFILVAFVVAGGFFLEPLVRSAGYDIPSDIISKVAGITAAVSGLAAGWFLKERWFAGKAWNIIRENYTVAGGYQKLVAEPVFNLARLFYKVELFLLKLVEQMGIAFLTIATSALSMDDVLSRISGKAGRAGLLISNASEMVEEKGVEAGVYGIASSINQSGRWGRKLQSGLVHKELVITVAGLLVLIFVLIVMISYE